TASDCRSGSGADGHGRRRASDPWMGFRLPIGPDSACDLAPGSGLPPPRAPPVPELRFGESTAVESGRSPAEPSRRERQMLDRTHRFRRASLVAALLIGAVTLAGCGARTGPNNKQNALRPAGPYARQILNLTRPFFWIAVVIGVGILAATI